MYWDRKTQYNDRALGSRSIFNLGGTGVDQLGSVLHHTLDQSLLLELIERLAGQRTADLEPLRNHGRCDQFVGRDFL